MKEIVIRKADPSEYDAVERFYGKVKYPGSLNSAATVLVALEDQQVIGTAQLCPEAGYVALRGMQVDPTFQGQGIGSKLLEHVVIELANQLCYCIPWSHLGAFYHRIGFEEITAQEGPVDVRERYTRCRNQGLNVILMRRVWRDC